VLLAELFVEGWENVVKRKVDFRKLMMVGPIVSATGSMNAG